MLANERTGESRSGALSKDVQLQGAALQQLLAFIEEQLPRWRDRTDRKPEAAETTLTSQLCAHLNSAARHSDGWDILQFRVEETDEQEKVRKIDLIAAPCGATVWIDARSYTDFDSLLLIECKRLPIPKGNDRDEREYVFSEKSTTGGVQRFKAGHHGAGHLVAAMIGYVQEGTAMFWHNRITTWIGELAKAGQRGWSDSDLLTMERNDEAARLAVLHSSHDRDRGLSKIELHHLWVGMN